MSKQQPTVQCAFTPAGDKLSALVEASFRLYLRSILAQETADNAPRA